MTERQLFEKWILSRSPQACLDRGRKGEYVVDSVQKKWTGWKAAITTLKQHLKV